jgi:hypothetical protein
VTFLISAKGPAYRRRHRPDERTGPWQRSSPLNDPLLFVIPSVPGFPAAPLSSATPDVVLFKENHTQPTEAAIFDRKSGEAEGSAVRHSCAPLLPAQTSTNHHRILVETLTSTSSFRVPGVVRVTADPFAPAERRTDLSRDTALVARSRRTSAVLILPMLLGAFRPLAAKGKNCCAWSESI